MKISVRSSTCLWLILLNLLGPSPCLGQNSSVTLCSERTSHQRIDTLIEKTKYRQALQAIDSLLKEDSSCAQTCFEKGTCLVNLEEPDKAIEAFKKGLAHQPLSCNWGIKAYAQAYIDKQDFPRAITIVSRFLPIAQDPAELYNFRGRLWANQNAYTRAWADFNKGIELEKKPQMRDYLNRGKMSMKLKQYKSAIADFQKASQIHPGNSYIVVCLAEAWRAAGNEAEAKKAYERARSLSPVDLE